MGKIIKVGDNYFVEFIGNGLLFQKLAGPDKSAAEKMLLEIEESLTKEETNIFVPKEMVYEDFCERFIAYAQQSYHQKTQYRLLSTLRHFNVFLYHQYPGLKKLKEITPRVIEEYKASLIKEFSLKKSKLINFTLFLLKIIFEFAVKERGLNDNPTLHIKIKYEKNVFDRTVYNLEFANNLLNLNPNYKEIGRDILQRGLKADNNFTVKHGEKEFNRYYFRHVFVLNLLDQGMRLFDVFKILQFKDIARVMIYAPYEKSKLS